MQAGAGGGVSALLPSGECCELTRQEMYTVNHDISVIRVTKCFCRKKSVSVPAKNPQLRSSKGPG